MLTLAFSFNYEIESIGKKGIAYMNIYLVVLAHTYAFVDIVPFLIYELGFFIFLLFPLTNSFSMHCRHNDDYLFLYYARHGVILDLSNAFNIKQNPYIYVYIRSHIYRVSHVDLFAHRHCGGFPQKHNSSTAFSLQCRQMKSLGNHLNRLMICFTSNYGWLLII